MDAVEETSPKMKTCRGNFRIKDNALERHSQSNLQVVPALHTLRYFHNISPKLLSKEYSLVLSLELINELVLYIELVQFSTSLKIEQKVKRIISLMKLS